MFNDKTIKSKRKISSVLAGAAVLALAVTFGYSTVANAQIEASVSKPSLRTQYISSDTIELADNVNLVNGNRKINISLRDSDLRPTLRMIADKAGLNIIFHNSVSGKVTLDLVNVTLNDAFKMIMQACDLSYVIDNGTLIVMSKDASLSSDISKQSMMTLPVKYVDSSKLAEFLNTNVFSTNRPGLSNNKIVVTNPVTNELILFGTENDYKMAQKVVAKLDVAPKTTAYRINHTTPREMAVLICQSLFPDASTNVTTPSAGGAGAGAGAMMNPMGGMLGGMVTGGASSSGSNGDEDSNSGGKGSFGGDVSGGTDESISLGEGVVACTVKPGNVDGSLKSLAGSALTITYFQHKGTINVTGGSDGQAEMIKNFIVANDKKQPQAYIDVQVVDLTEEGSKDFQNNWHILTPFFSAEFTKDGLSNQFNGKSAPMFFAGGPHGTATTIDGTTYYNYVNDRWHGRKTVGWAINYLIQNEKGRLLANPKVVVTNGKKSVINITEDYVKSVDEQTSENGYTGGGPIVTREYEIEEDDLGLVIEITPFISPDGYVTLNLKPSFSTIAHTEESVSSYGSTPITAAVLLKRRKLDLSNVRVKDGETLVLGGLVQENEKKTVSKVPLLGDLPIIGSAFRNTKTENAKSELVIMVTPHIIKDTEDSVAENL